MPEPTPSPTPAPTAQPVVLNAVQARTLLQDVIDAEPTPAPTFPPTPAPGVNPDALAAQQALATAADKSAAAVAQLAAEVGEPDLLNPARVRWSLMESLLKAYANGLPALSASGGAAPDVVRLAFDRSGDVIRWLRNDHPTWFAPTPPAE